MIKRNVPRMALAASLLIVLAQLIGGIGCQGESVSTSPITEVWQVVYAPVKWLGEQIGHRGVRSSYAIVSTARETIYAHINWLEEQQFEGPDQLAPLDVTVDGLKSETRRIGRGGDVHANLGVEGIGVGGLGGGLGGGGGGG